MTQRVTSTSDLTDEDIAAIDERVQRDAARYGHGYTITYEDGEWIAHGPHPDDQSVNVTSWALGLYEGILRERREVERRLRFKKTVLLMRDHSTDDEFVEWCAEVLPLLLCK